MNESLNLMLQANPGPNQKNTATENVRRPQLTRV